MTGQRIRDTLRHVRATQPDRQTPPVGGCLSVRLCVRYRGNQRLVQWKCGSARVSAGMGAVSCHAQGLAKHELARIRADYPEAG